MSGTQFDYAVHQRVPDDEIALRRWPVSGYLSGDLFDLAHLIPTVAMPKERVEAVAAQVSDLVSAAADRLEAGLPSGAQNRVAALMRQRTTLRGLQTTALLWLNALLVQQRLFVQDAAAVDVGALESSKDLSQQTQVWRRIIDDNWRSIFEPAVEGAGAGGVPGPATGERGSGFGCRGRSLDREGAARNAHQRGRRALPEAVRRPEGGRQPSTRSLRPRSCWLRSRFGWSALRPVSGPGMYFANRRLADFACGTGTLLRAGYRRIEALHERGGRAHGTRSAQVGDGARRCWGGRKPHRGPPNGILAGRNRVRRAIRRHADRLG